MIVNQIKLAADRREELQRVSPGFPVSIYQTDFSCPEYRRVNWHWHQDFQLCRVIRGSVLFHVAGQTCRVPVGKGIFINGRLAHAAEPGEDGSIYDCVNFSPELICTPGGSPAVVCLLTPFLKNGVAPFFRFDGGLPGGASILDAMRRIIRLSEVREPEGWELLIQSELLHIWPSVWALAQGSGGAISDQSDQRLKRVLTYLNEHYSEKLTLKDVAREAFLCPEECERFFKRMTGVTVFQYLMGYRVEKGRELLVRTELPIAAVAQRCGFSTQSYFTVCFQKQTGFTPNQYRKEERTRNAAVLRRKR